jgi:hypothetical protein
MSLLNLILLLAAADPDDGLAKIMLPIYRKEVAEYSLAVESAPKKALELKNDPILEWSNPIRAGVQQGVIFLWLRDGRPAALGCFFSVPHKELPGRTIYHELHALDREKLLVSRPDALNEWKPQAGLARKELPGAEAPAATRAARLGQMRRLAREFTGYEISPGSKRERGELRLLPAPLYRYPEAEKAVVDGALFAFVSTVGTDPEVLLLIEAHEEGGKTRWEYACGRFSNWDLYMQHKGKEVWSSVLNESNTRRHDPLYTYCNYPDKVVSLEGKVLTRIRALDLFGNSKMPP